MLRDDSLLAQSNITANLLAAFFVDKVEAIRASKQHCLPPSFVTQQKHAKSVFTPCTMADICRTILCSPPKSCSLDPLPFSLFMTSLEHILQFFQLVCNLSLHTGMVPSAEKHVVVTQILKKSNLDSDDVKNYRPISNLSFLSKLIEQLVSKQLTTYLIENKLMPVFQSAYRQTETAVLKIVSNVYDAAETGHLVCNA
jgi:hypothetical protein